MVNDHSVYVPERFSMVVKLHLVRNLQPDPPYNAPLLLGVHGRPGEGKTFQLRYILNLMGIHTSLLSGGQLESSDAGEPGARIRDAYLSAGSAVSNGVPAAVLLNDADAAIGHWGDLTQYTVNTQNVITELMHLCDYPTKVEGRTTPRVPIFLTGNDFTRLYGPLRRHGRMDLFKWEMSQQERAVILAGIFGSLSAAEIDKLLSLHPDYSIADWTAVAARITDVNLTTYLSKLDARILLAKIVQGARLEGVGRAPDFQDVVQAIDYLNGNIAVNML